MAYTISVPTLSDTAALARNNMSAFWSDPTWRIMWTHPDGLEVPLDDIIKSATARMPYNLTRDRDVRRHIKAVDLDGRIVGYARWILPDASLHDAWPEAQVVEVSREERKAYLEMHRQTRWNIRQDMDPVDEPVIELHNKLKHKKSYLILDYLAVHPDHKGKGIATLLVQNGVEAADRLGLDVYVLAYQAGLNIYRRAGFRLLDQITLNDAVYGGEGDFTRYYLERITNRPGVDGEPNPDAGNK